MFTALGYITHRQIVVELELFNLEIKSRVVLYIYTIRVFKYIKVTLTGKETNHPKYLLPVGQELAGLNEDKGDSN